MENNFIEKWIGILVFKIANIEFGYNITQIHVFSSVTPEQISEGYLTHINDKIPLYYIEELFKKNSRNNKKYSYVLALESNQGPIGFGIDEIIEVLPIDIKILENEIILEEDNSNEFLLGNIRFEGRKILIPDFEKIIEQMHSSKIQEMILPQVEI